MTFRSRLSKFNSFKPNSKLTSEASLNQLISDSDEHCSSYSRFRMQLK